MEYRNELYHHGVLGQKWGKRNGPPYPLKASDHSVSEKKAGWRKSLDSSEKDSYNSGRKIHLTDRQKKAIAIGIAAAVAIGGTAYLVHSGKIDVLLPKGKATASDILDGFGGIPMSDIDNDYVSPDDLSFHKISNFSGGSPSEMRILNDLSALKKKQPKGGETNCVACAIEGFLRNNYGFDVVAKERGTEFTIAEVEALFSNYKQKAFPSVSSKAELGKVIRKELLAQGDGATGLVGCKFSDEYKKRYYERFGKEVKVEGHAFSWTICDGRLVFYDYQHREIGDHVLSAMILAGRLDGFSYGRFDGSNIDQQLIHIFCENRTGVS